MAKSNPTFKMIHLDTDEGMCPNYALFSSNGYNTVLMGNRALRRHPETFIKAWDEVKEEVKETFGFHYQGSIENLPWVTQRHHSNSVTTYLYKGSKLVGEVQVDKEGIVLGSLDYTSPREDAQGHSYWSLSKYVEDFAASIS